MIEYELLVTRLLISVQDFAFRRRPMSLLVACAPAGAHLFRFSCRSLRLALQSTARSTCIYPINKKIRTSLIFDSPSKIKLVRNFLQLTYFCYLCFSKASFNPNPINTTPVALSIKRCTLGVVSHFRK